MSPLTTGIRTRGVAPHPYQYPQTPDPDGRESFLDAPPPPPRARLRLRRNAPKLKTNTAQFLESVSSADIPIPSIEGPHVYDEEAMTVTSETITANGLLVPDFNSQLRSKSPKTPAPEHKSPNGLMDWYQFDNLEYSESEASRPSTARSSGTFASVFSQLSQLSDHSGYQVYHNEIPQTPLFLGDPDMTLKARPHHPTAKRAHWTKAAEQHLWKTYLLYQQDATVTPYKVGSNNVPPPGVLDRVSTMAHQTWKQACAKFSYGAAPVVEWPHSRGAARAHLRELCLSQARKSSRTPQLPERSAKPSFPTAIRFKNRRLGMTPSPCPFSGRDMVMSLAVSTADSMQPQGPLAQLALSNGSKMTHPLSSPLMSHDGSGDSSRPRLASPFPLNTYGPSVSVADETSNYQTRPQTVTAVVSRSLGSSAQGDESNVMGKRRARPSLPEPPKAKRPSLTSDLWNAPSTSLLASSSPPHHPEPGSSPCATQQREIEGPHLNLLEQLNALTENSMNLQPEPPIEATVETPVTPRRLGSPFTGRLSSFSFPGRISRPREVPRSFATINGVAGRIKAPRTPVPRRALEERLRDFCRRARRRSQSPQ